MAVAVAGTKEQLGLGFVLCALCFVLVRVAVAAQ